MKRRTRQKRTVLSSVAAREMLQQRVIQDQLDRFSRDEPLPNPAKSRLPDQVFKWQCAVFRKYEIDDEGAAVIQLLASDDDLDRETRDFIASELERLYFPAGPKPEPEPNREQAEFAASIRKLKTFLQKNGLPAGEAEQEIAGALKITVEALRKRLQRAPK
jgi:hypothetical protein